MQYVQRYLFLILYLLIVGGIATIAIGFVFEVSGLVPIGGVLALLWATALAAHISKRNAPKPQIPDRSFGYRRHRRY